MYGWNASIPIIIPNSIPNGGFNSECVLRKVRSGADYADSRGSSKSSVSTSNSDVMIAKCQRQTPVERSALFRRPKPSGNKFSIRQSDFQMFTNMFERSKRNLQFHEYLGKPPGEEPSRQQINSIQLSFFHQHTAETSSGEV